MQKPKSKEKRTPRKGFRRRINSYYGNMTPRQIAADTAKTAVKWLIFTALAYVYWLVMLLMLSIFLLNVWHVQFTQILIYALLLCVITSVVYAGMLIHRKFYY